MKRLFIVGVLVPAVILAASAAGSGSKAWRQLSDPGAASGVGLARTSNGTLHVIWAKGGAAFDTRIATNGTLSRAGIVKGWQSIVGPAAVVASDGSLRAFLPGSIRAGDAGDDVGIHTATSPQSGATWTLDSQAVWGGSLANQRDVAAVVGRDGSPVTAIGGGGAQFFRGLERGQQATVLPPVPYSYDPEVGADAATGAITAAWYVDQGGRRGIVTQSVYPAAGGQRFVGAADTPVDVGVSGRVAAPGIYLVLTSPAGIRFGRVGGAPRLIAKDADARAVDVSTGPAGRLWVSWLSGDGTLHALRSNRAASRFGQQLTVAPPASGVTSFKLAGEGSAGPLDAVARYGVGSAVSWWTTHLVPVLSLGTARNSKTGKATITVTDVGDPVAGAKVRVAGRTTTSDAAGHATVTNVAAGATVSVTAAGYRPGSTTLK